MQIDERNSNCELFVGRNATKVYIAGRITGDKDYKEKFRQKEQELTRKGCIVLNPATLPSGMTKADYMRICFAMIDIADVVFFLPDWIHSEGAKVEYAYSSYIRKDMYGPLSELPKENVEWIETECEQPDIGDKVLIYPIGEEGDVETAQYNGEGEYVCHGRFIAGENIDYWAYIPKPHG